MHFLYFILAWLIGGILTYSLDGLFNYFDKWHYSDAVCACIFWPIFLLVMTPYGLRLFFTKIRINHLNKKEQQKKIRIAKIKETSELFEVAEKEAEEILNK